MQASSSSLFESTQSFVQHVEVWTPKDGSVWHRTVADRFGSRSEDVPMRGSFAARHPLASRILGTSRAEVIAREGGYDVTLGIPIFRGDRVDSVVVLGCQGTAGRGGCVEVWEPNARDELVHAEGYYGVMQDFELSSRLARFRRATGLPGITWDRATPHIIPDVRASSAFVRTELARQHRLSVGLGIPVLRRDEVTQVLALITASSTPPAAIVEVWVPDRSGRLWLDQAVHAPGYEALARSSRTTCFMRGEGTVGRAFDTQRPVTWSGFVRDAHPFDADASRAGLDRGVAIPIVAQEGPTSILVMRM